MITWFCWLCSTILYHVDKFNLILILKYWYNVIKKTIYHRKNKPKHCFKKNPAKILVTGLSLAVQKGHSKVYGNPIAPTLYSIHLGNIHINKMYISLQDWICLCREEGVDKTLSQFGHLPRLERSSSLVNSLKYNFIHVKNLLS